MALLGNTTVYGTLSGSGVIYDPSGNSTQWNLGYSLASGVSGSLTGYALKSQTGSFVTTAQTGVFYAASNPSGYITGVNLSSYATYIQLTGLSGYDALMYATITNLGLTGSTLASSISSLSGTLTGSYYPLNNPSNYITGVSQFSYITGYDVSGSLLSPTVTSIQGLPIQPSAPGLGQTLQWNGSAWAPGAVAAGGNGGGGITYYFDFLNQSGLAPSGGLNTGLTPVSLWGKTYSVGSGQYTTPDLSPKGSDILVSSFLTASGDPNISNIPAGLWDFNIWASTNSTNATQTALKVVVNIYNPSGAGSYRLLGASDYVYLYDATAVAQYLLNVTVPQTGISTNERLYVQMFAVKNTNTARTITIYYDSYRPSHCHTTIPAVAGNGVVKVINGVYQSPATGIFDSDVDANAQIQQSKILGLTSSLASLYPKSNPSGFISSVPNTVYTTGAQTISGTKTFNTDVNINGTLALSGNGGSLISGYGNEMIISDGSITGGQGYGSLTLGFTNGVYISGGIHGDGANISNVAAVSASIATYANTANTANNLSAGPDGLILYDGDGVAWSININTDGTFNIYQY